MQNKIQFGARILLGALLLVFGLNKFIGFLPAMELAENARAFFAAILATGYLLKVVALVEISVGVLLLINKFQALALLLLAPISVNIILFHLFLDPAIIAPAALVTILNGYLLFANKEKYDSILASS